MRYERILVIDDDADDQEIFLAAIASVSKDVACSTANSAIDALKALDNRSLNPDLIFLDLNMPIMTGQQFLEEIKKKEGLCEIPVIVLSTSSHQQTIELTRSLGAADFITKPGKFDELVSILRNIIKLS
jgi:CheY-like chemotaxis protein